MKVWVCIEDTGLDDGWNIPEIAFDSEEKAKEFCKKHYWYDYFELEVE